MASCPGDNSITNDDFNNINNRAQFVSNLSKFALAFLSKRRCRKPTYPSFTSVIYNLSTNTSVTGSYSLIYINGDNFQAPCMATTYINFTNASNSYTRLPITFFSSSYISFVVPTGAPAGSYSVVAVNIYNGNFSPQVNNAYPGILDYSNVVNYVLT